MKLLFATANLHKFEEVKDLIPDGVELNSLNDIQFDREIPETKSTIEGNAQQKVDFIYDCMAIECFADDTGLEVDALHGRPGVYSARYAGPGKDSQKNMEKLLDELKGVPNRAAQFKTVIALRFAQEVHLFTGILRGQIIHEQRGKYGFGYDPIFIPDGFNQTLAEMTREEKNKISHRSIAFEQLITFLESQQ